MRWPENITGVIHGGAHLAEELGVYAERGVTHTIWIEPQRALATQLVTRGLVVFHVALGATGERRTMHMASNGQSSSLLPPAKHREAHPDITFSGFDEVTVAPLDELHFDRSKYQMLVLDTQGYELEALRGATETLKTLRAVQCEIARVELYEGQPLLGDLDTFLTAAGFRLTDHFFWPGSDEGEGLWESQ